MEKCKYFNFLNEASEDVKELSEFIGDFLYVFVKRFLQGMLGNGVSQLVILYVHKSFKIYNPDWVAFVADTIYYNFSNFNKSNVYD